MNGLADRRGSALVFALIVSIILVAMVGALSLVAARESEVVLDSRQLERARLITEAGLNLVVEDYQKDQAAPPKAWYDSPQPFGEGAFQILSDTSLGGVRQRRLVQVEGTLDESDWRIEAVIGPIVKPLFDAAIQANSDIQMDRMSGVDSFDSRIGPYDPASPRDNGDVKGNGNIVMDQVSTIAGDLQVKGTITLTGGSSVSGTSEAQGDGVPLPSVDTLVAKVAASLSLMNDNAILDPTIVVPVGPDTAIQIPKLTTKIVTSGDYYIHTLTAEREATLVFDTTGGPVNMVIHDGDFDMGRMSNVVVVGDKPVRIFMSGFNTFNMQQYSNVLNPARRCDLFQVIINSNDIGSPRFWMRQYNDYYGTVWAPDADLQIDQGTEVYGALIGRTVQLDQTDGVHYDEALMDGQWILIPDSYRVYFKRRVV